MKNMTKNKNEVYTIIVLAVLIGILAFLQSDKAEYNYQISILERSAIYAVMAVPMNLLTGFTGLFSPGQAGFTATGAYVAVISTIPVGSRASVYYVSDISPVTANVQLPIPVALLLGELAATGLAVLIGISVLRTRSNYLAIVTLGFPEIIRVSIVAPMFDIITNGSYGLKSIPGSPNIFTVFGLAALCIGLMMLLINSSYGRASKFIREDKIVAQFMGINLFHYKELPFVIPSFFTGVGGGVLAMFMRSTDSKTFQMALTYDVLLIVVPGGIGNVTGSMLGSFVATAGHEAPCLFDDPLIIADIHIPLFRSGSRMVIFSIPLMAVVLFYSRDIMGNKEFPWEGLFRLIRGTPHKLKGKEKKASALRKGGAQ